ncbi:putative phosphoglucomutase-2, partial [Tetrabaena socialis]
TAGLRGLMGPGSSRMNAVVVQQTAQGLCRYLQQTCPGKLAAGGVVVGYDGRHGSAEFASITARVFAAEGVRVALFRRVVPTPFVAAGVAVLGCAAGVMVTASHNPKEYNGYKDKDGISAAAAFTELAAHTYGSGGTLDGLLRQLYDRYGFFDYRAGYFVADRPEKSRAVFAELRGGGGSGGGGGAGAGAAAARYASSIAGVAVEHVRDLGTGLDSRQPDGRVVLPWQPGDMMISYYLAGGATLTLRASGTEPKLKYYLEVVGTDAAAAGALADRLVGALAEEVVGVTRHGLQRPASS